MIDTVRCVQTVADYAAQEATLRMELWRSKQLEAYRDGQPGSTPAWVKPNGSSMNAIWEGSLAKSYAYEWPDSVVDGGCPRSWAASYKGRVLAALQGWFSSGPFSWGVHLSELRRLDLTYDVLDGAAERLKETLKKAGLGMAYHTKRGGQVVVSRGGFDAGWSTYLDLDGIEAPNEKPVKAQLVVYDKQREKRIGKPWVRLELRLRGSQGFRWDWMRDDRMPGEPVADGAWYVDQLIPRAWNSTATQLQAFASSYRSIVRVMFNDLAAFAYQAEKAWQNGVRPWISSC